MRTAWYETKWGTLVIHVLCWGLFFMLPYFYQIAADGKPHTKVYDFYFYEMMTFENLLRLGIFYLNAFYFIPVLAYRKRPGIYFLIILFTYLLLVLTCRAFAELIHYQYYGTAPMTIVFQLFPFFLIIALSSVWRLASDRKRREEIAKEKENENLKTELSFLRSQVSPHFMFNVLNNMVSLARKKSDDLEPSLMKLSSLLRYMLYETNADKVLLEKEIEYLHSYIDLQQQRFGKKVTINAEFEQGAEGHLIEPMLLVPFVENAYKHSSGLVNNATINLLLSVRDNTLRFTVSNRYIDNTGSGDKTSGIGLSNVQRRLELLYHNKHSLSIRKEPEWFHIELNIELA